MESEDDWSNFQHSLRVIQTCGDLIMHLEEFDGTVISSIINSVDHLHTTGLYKEGAFRFSTKKTPLHAQASVFLSSADDIESLVAMVTSLHEGKIIGKIMSHGKSFSQISLIKPPFGPTKSDLDLIAMTKLQ